MPAELADVERQKNIQSSNSRLQRRAGQGFTLLFHCAHGLTFLRACAPLTSTRLGAAGIRYNDRVKSFPLRVATSLPRRVGVQASRFAAPFKVREAMVTPIRGNLCPRFRRLVFDTALPVASSVILLTARRPNLA